MKNKFQNGCIICSMKYFIKYGNIHGIILFNYKCPHVDKSVKQKCIIKFAHIYLILNILQVLLLCIESINLFIEFLDAFYEFQSFSNVIVIYNLAMTLFCSYCGFIITSSIILRQIEKQYMVQIIELLKSSNVILFTKKSERKLRHIFNTITFSGLILIIFIVILQVYNVFFTSSVNSHKSKAGKPMTFVF